MLQINDLVLDKTKFLFNLCVLRYLLCNEVRFFWSPAFVINVFTVKSLTFLSVWPGVLDNVKLLLLKLKIPCSQVWSKLSDKQDCGFKI